MKLRARLALTLALSTLPVVGGLVWGAQVLRRQSILESTYEETVARMEGGGLERCETLGARFVDQRPRRRREPRRLGRASVRRIYDDRFRPLDPRSRPLDPPLRAELEAGEEYAAQWRGDRVTIAMRMPWDGRCSIVVLERRAPVLRESGRAVGWAIAIALSTAAIALIATGPVVRRIRRLTHAVRGQASGRYANEVEVEGNDEIAELGRAFNQASHEIRTRLAELADRDRALTEFLANTTHDVMVPLTVLQGHLSELRDRLRERGASEAIKVGAALEEAHYLGALVRNLAAAARLEAGEPMLTRHAFDLRGVLDRVIARHAPIAKERGIELAHAVPENEVAVIADSTLVEQAVGNLVHNAIRYNRPGGHVAVVLEARAGSFELAVIDDGPGIAPDELAHVAERRFRGGAARARQPTGLGLGLHIVRDVAEKHGWALRFESPAEGGLRVVIDGG